MHEKHDIEIELRSEANRLSQKYGGAPVVVIVAGSKEADVPRCMTGTSMHGETETGCEIYSGFWKP